MILPMGMAPPPKRPGTMSDDERARVGERYRKQTPALGVPVSEFDDRDFTPVSVTLERIEAAIGDQLSPREQRIVQALVARDANAELRARQRRDTGDTAQLARRIDDLESSVVDIAGKNGNNGKVGTLKERLDKAEARRWWAITFIAGLIVTIVGSAYSFGSRIGALEAEVEALELRAQRTSNVSPPDYPATKEGPQP